MLRAENCICGTSTTGTGTLTLAACPTPPGGTDLYQAFSAQNFTGSLSVSYCIIEYTNANLNTAKQQEKGVGTLALGGNITATTLARTTVQQTAINMDTSTPTYSVASPSAISIGTAANTLIFIGASSSEMAAYVPYFESSSTTFSALPVHVSGTGSNAYTHHFDHYFLFEWRVPMLAKRMRISIESPASGTIVRAYGRLYDIGTNGRPSKLLYDFGTFTGSNVLNSAAGSVISTAATGNGIFMSPGEYFVDLMPEVSGIGAASGTLRGMTPIISGRLGYVTASTASIIGYTASGGVIGAAPDPANVTAIGAVNASANQMFTFALSPS